MISQMYSFSFFLKATKPSGTSQHWFILSAFFLSLVLSGQPSHADEVATLSKIDLIVIEKISNDLAEGRRSTGSKLSQLGFAEQVKQIETLDNSQLHAFSAQTMIESLWRGAEAKSKDEGDRFLAIIYQAAIKESAALEEETKNDPKFKKLRQYTSTELARPIKFALPITSENIKSHTPLSDLAEHTIQKLAEFYAGAHMAHFRAIALKRFKKQGFSSQVFEKILAESKTSKEAMERLVRAGMPLPPIEEGLREALIDSMQKSFALKLDKEARELKDALSISSPTKSLANCKNVLQ